jgi:hypothetical protein
MGYTIPWSYRSWPTCELGRHVGAEVGRAHADVARPDADDREGAAGDQLAGLLLRHAECRRDSGSVEQRLVVWCGRRVRGCRRPDLELERLQLAGDLRGREVRDAVGELA